MADPIEREATGDLISANRVTGTEVYNHEGTHLGSIDDVMLHRHTDRIAYAIMSFGGFLGIGEKYHPVPWSVLSYDEGRGGYVVNLTEDQLRDAPAFTRDDIREDDRAWREPVYTHYGVTPYWSML